MQRFSSLFLISSSLLKSLLQCTYATLVKKAFPFLKVCTRVQSSEMTKFLGIFEDQKMEEMDIISCHDWQFVKCKNELMLFAWIDFKYKKVHIHRIWDNDNECNKQCYQIGADIFCKTLNVSREHLNCISYHYLNKYQESNKIFSVVPSGYKKTNFKGIFLRH